MIPDSIPNTPNALFIVTGEQLHDLCERTSRATAEMVRQEIEQATAPYVARTTEQVAQMFTTTRRNVERWIEKNIVTPTCVGGIVRIDPDEIRKLQHMKLNRNKQL